MKQQKQNTIEETVLLKLRTYEELVDTKQTFYNYVNKNLIEFVEGGKTKRFVCADKTERLDNLATANVCLIDENTCLKRQIERLEQTKDFIKRRNETTIESLQTKNKNLLLNNKILAIVLISVVVLSYSCWFLI